MYHMEPSIFTRIINGEIPCHKVYEDDRTLAFLDIHPIQEGHTLVVSKKQVPNFYELSEEDNVAVFSTVQKVAKALKKSYPDAFRIGVMVEGLDVAHVHVKVFPFNSSEEYRFIPDMTTEPDHAALAKVADTLSKEIQGV